MMFHSFNISSNVYKLNNKLFIYDKPIDKKTKHFVIVQMSTRDKLISIPALGDQNYNKFLQLCGTRP